MIGISAQVSLYPLGQEDLSPAIDEALNIFLHHGLDVNPGSMSTLICGDEAAVFSALQDAFRRAAKAGRVVMVTTFSNACPLPSDEELKRELRKRSESETFQFRAIGYVENEFRETTKPDTLTASPSRIILAPDLMEGLSGLEPGMTLSVIFVFHRAKGYDLLQHPRGDRSRPQRGVFSLRSPNRPNPIGITEVELLAVERNVLTVRGLDALDGTPVLDLKPGTGVVRDQK